RRADRRRRREGNRRDRGARARHSSPGPGAAAHLRHVVVGTFMKVQCASPLSEEVLTEYWTRELEGEREAAVEEHLFNCSDCGTRLKTLAAMGAGVVELARQGRVSGIISRPLLNLLQSENVNVRLYTVSPVETIPCAIYPDDDIVVLSMHADLTDVETVDLQVTG